MTINVNESNFIKIGDVNQFVIIRGKNTNNPILLMLHGGTTEIAHFIKFNKDLEEYFTVVYWEQRGEGKSYSQEIIDAEPELEQYIEDAYELTNYLKNRLDKEKIFLLGHSWGSMLGMKTIEKYPNDYEAYIAVSQYCDPLRSDKLMFEFFRQQTNKESILQKIDVLDNLKKDNIESLELVTRTYKIFPLVMKFGGLYHENKLKNLVRLFWMPILRLKEYNLFDKYRAMQQNEKRLQIYYQHNFFETLLEVKIPIYFMHGISDYVINYNVTKEYFEKLEAPKKCFFTFDKSGHLPAFEEPEKFNDIVVNEILLKYFSEKLRLEKE
jgi:pimeloyl-ACP methyl ester carboxylesterase